MNNDFITNYNKNVNQYVEKKEVRFGKENSIIKKFNYLSWAYAVKELKTMYPESSWIQHFDGSSPYFQDKSGAYVKITLFLSKEDRKENFGQDIIYPVLDQSNKAVLNPNSFQVNTSFMRGLTKLIAMCTGIGLYIYAGEDLPENTENQEIEKAKIHDIERNEKEQKRKGLENNLRDSIKKDLDVFEKLIDDTCKKYPTLYTSNEFIALCESIRSDFFDQLEKRLKESKISHSDEIASILKQYPSLVSSDIFIKIEERVRVSKRKG